MTASMPPPPQWVTDMSVTFLDRVAVPLYVLLAVTSFAVWGVLRWQRRPGETRAAASFRAFCFAKGVLWGVLAATRWMAPSWRLPLYDVVVVYVLATTLYVLGALVWTYVVPACRGDPAPPLEGAVLPDPEEWSGEERRVGPPDRRRPPKVGA